MVNLLTHEELLQRAEELAAYHRKRANELERSNEEARRAVERSREVLSESLKFLRPDVAEHADADDSEPAVGEKTDGDAV